MASVFFVSGACRSFDAPPPATGWRPGSPRLAIPPVSGAGPGDMSRHLPNGVPSDKESAAIDRRRQRSYNGVDHKWPVDMREELRPSFKVLHPNGDRESAWVDLQHDDGLGDRGVEERADALNLIAERTVNEADPFERCTERRHPVLAAELGRFPIACERNVKYVPGVTDLDAQVAVLAPSKFERSAIGTRNAIDTAGVSDGHD